MRCLWAIGIVGVIGGCGSAGGVKVVNAGQAGDGSAASCVGLTAAQELQAARIAFDGRMLAGPTVVLGGTHVLASPARVRVTRYLKGDGPRTVEVQTAGRRSATGLTVDAEGIEPRVGQRWRIYSDRARQPFPTTVCGGSRPLPASEARRRRFTGGGLSFAYPPSWLARHFEIRSSFSSEIVYLSPQRMHPPCVTRHGTHNITITCRQPITRLRPGSILAFWSINSMPGLSSKRATGTPLAIGGRPARLRMTHSSRGIGARQTIDALIPTMATDNSWYEFIACIRGPHTLLRQQQLRELLGSVRFEH